MGLVDSEWKQISPPPKEKSGIPNNRRSPEHFRNPSPEFRTNPELNWAETPWLLPGGLHLVSGTSISLSFALLEAIEQLLVFVLISQVGLRSAKGLQATPNKARVASYPRLEVRSCSLTGKPKNYFLEESPFWGSLQGSKDFPSGALGMIVLHQTSAGFFGKVWG